VIFNQTKRIAFVLVVIAFAAQRVYSDVNDLAAESLKLYKQVEAINAEKEAAAGKERKRIKEIEKLLRELNPEIIQKYTRQIQQYTAQIEDLKRRIADLEHKIEKVKNADPESRRAEKARLETQISELRAREREIARPFNDRIEDLKRTTPEKKAAYQKAMEKYCLIPGKQYGEVIGTHVSATLGDSIILYRWNSGDRNQVAWAHLRLRDKPVILHPSAKKLDDTYYVTSHSDSSIWLWAGHFQICFVMCKEEWQGKEKIAEAIKHFVDLKGLAKICATKEVQ
jgi:hypothetical protein